MRGEADHELTTIRGLVTPYEWDEKGNVIALTISTFDEEEYLIDEGTQGTPFPSLVRQIVEVIGSIRYDGDRKVIKVKKYSVVLLSKVGFALDSTIRW